MTSGGINKVKRHPERASYDKEQLLDILKDGFVCQVAFQIAEQPFIIPMMYYNNSEYIYIHGSPAARIINKLREESQVAISVLEINGLVIAKRLANNSMNYRSVVIFGKPEEITDNSGKLAVFSEWINVLIPGRIEHTVLPSRQELEGVSVFRVKLENFSVKIREGEPSDPGEKSAYWSGVIPFSTQFSGPKFSSSSETPDYLEDFISKRNETKQKSSQ